MYIVRNDTRMDIVVYFLDTAASIADRIAWALNSLPRFVHIEDITRENVQYVDLWDTVAKNNDLLAIVNNLETVFDRNDIIFLWAMYHRQDEQQLLMVGADEQVRYRINSTNPGDYIRTLKAERSVFKNAQESIRTQMSFFEKKQSAHLTDLDTTTSVRNLFFNCTKTSLYSIFDNLHVSSKIPLITYNNYYKVLKNFTPPRNWNSSSDFIICKIVREKDEYDNIKISHAGGGDVFYVEFTVDAQSNPSTYFPDLFGDELNVAYIEEKTSHVGATFSTNVPIDDDIFADFILTTDKLDKFITANDNRKNAARSVLFTNAYVIDKSFVEATISHNIATVNDVYPPDTQYTLVRITNASNNDIINVFRVFFGKLMTLYNDKAPGIRDFYSRYMPPPSPQPVLQTAVGKKRFLKDAFPEIYKPVNKKSKKYSVMCQKQKQPVVVTEGIRPTDMMFPKNADIVEPQYYRCNNPLYPFPGLIKFDNRFGVAPCCFKVDQKDKAIYVNYFNPGGAQRQRKSTTSLYFKKTDKIIQLNEYGYFPDSGFIVNNIGPMFQVENIRNNVIIRMGVDNYPNSFLDCVLTALRSPVILDMTGEQRQNAVRNERASLLSRDVHPAVVMQEMYGESQTNIVNYIANVDEYLDPERVIRLVEHVYKCNILLFVKNDKYPDGHLIVPRHANGYCKHRRDDARPSIFIFNHTGTATEKSKYPHCELIIQRSRQDMQEDSRMAQHIDYVWTYNGGLDPIYNFCWSVYDRLSTFYYKDRKVVDTPTDLITATNIRDQHIDSYGKVRLLGVVFQGTYMVIETSPIAPLNLPLMEVPIPSLIRIEVIDVFVDVEGEEKVDVHYIGTYPQYKRRWHEDYFSVTLYIDSDNQFMYPRNTQFYDIEYINNSKIARYLTNWMMYMFSGFIKGKGEVNKTLIIEFVNAYFEVDGGFKYDADRVSEMFIEEEAAGILRGGKIVCTTLDLNKRLVYQLCLMYRRYRTRITNFSDKLSMDSYYMSVNDFTRYVNEIIIYQNPNAPVNIRDVLKTHSGSHRLHYDIAPHANPYFFRNKHIHNGSVVLAQNTDDLDEAVVIGAEWADSGYNRMNEDVMIREKIPFHMYTLSSSGEVKEYQVGQGPVPSNAAVLATETRMTSLLML